jgi:hypothetical protein
VHYRCGRCKRIGKQLVEEQKWAGFDRDRSGEEPAKVAEDRRRLESMGPITAEEMVDFHFSLDKLGTLEPSEFAEKD